MPTPVTLISGDGIGPSISSATVRILEAAGADIDWDPQYAGQAGVAKYGDPIPDETLDSIKRTRIALKGPLETPVGEGFRSINVALRKTFDLYANVRPAHTIVKGGRFEDIDIVLVREIRWIGDVRSDSSSVFSRALLSSLAAHFADLITAP